MVNDAPLPLRGLGQQHFLDDLLQGCRRALHRAGQRITPQRAEPHRFQLLSHPVQAAGGHRQPLSACRPARQPGAGLKNKAAQSECSPDRCTARCPARSSWRAGKHGCFRLPVCGRCKDSRFRAVGSSGPSGAGLSGRKRPALWRGFFLVRRAPPNAASKPYLSSACFRAWVFMTSVWTAEPCVNGPTP